MEYRYKKDNTIVIKPKHEYYGLTDDKIKYLGVYFKNPQKYRPTDKSKYQPGPFANLVYLLIWGTIIYFISGWRNGNLEIIPILVFLLLALIIYFGYSKVIAYFKRISDNDYLGDITDLDIQRYQLYKEAFAEYYEMNIIINWDYIQFVNGAIELTRISIGKKYTFPYDCKSEYSQYIYLLKNKFPEVQIHYEKGKPCLSNPDIFDEVIEIILTYIEEKKKEEKERLEAIIIANPYLRESVEKRNIIKNEIKKSRSEYLNYLYEHQAQDKIIVKTYERPIYANQSNLPYERAYIFTLEKCKGEYCIIFENTNDYARASIVLEADDETYAECLKAIYDFMRCPKTLNKREKLQKEKKVDEFVSHSISHKDIVSWQNKILGYKRSRTTIRKYRKRYRRWY